MNIIVLLTEMVAFAVRLSDASGKMEFSQSKRGSVNMSDLDTKVCMDHIGIIPVYSCL